MTCDYCKAVGACPKCWGRAAVDELKAERDEAVALLRDWQAAFQWLPREVAANNARTYDRVAAFLGRVNG